MLFGYHCRIVCFSCLVKDRYSRQECDCQNLTQVRSLRNPPPLFPLFLFNLISRQTAPQLHFKLAQFILDPSLLSGDPGYPQHLAPLSAIDSNLPLPSPLVPPKTPPKPSTSDYISSSSWIEPPQPQPQTKMTRSRSPSSTSSSSSSSGSDLYETDSEADNEAQLQFEESVRQLQSLVNLVVVPWVSRYFGRKWSYYRMSISILHLYSLSLSVIEEYIVTQDSRRMYSF